MPIIELFSPTTTFAISRKVKHLENIAEILKSSAPISKIVVTALYSLLDIILSTQTHFA
jgi:hypothetical protein